MNLGLTMLVIGSLAAVLAIWLASGLQTFRAATHALGARTSRESRADSSEQELSRGPRHAKPQGRLEVGPESFAREARNLIGRADLIVSVLAPALAGTAIALTSARSISAWSSSPPERRAAIGGRRARVPERMHRDGATAYQIPLRYVIRASAIGAR
jgi:hypothetical protein